MAIAVDSEEVAQVGTAGTIIPLTIPPGYRDYDIRHVCVQMLNTDLGRTFKAELTTDPLAMDTLKQIAHFDGGSALLPIHSDWVYPWDWRESDGIVYIKVTPSIGLNNRFKVRLLVGRRY